VIRLSLLVLVGALLVGCPKAPTVEGPIAEYLPDEQARKHYVRGKMAEERGDLVEAERNMDWVTKLDAASPFSWLAQGRFLENVGRYTEALESYRQAEERESRLVDVKLALGRALVRTGRDEEARPYLIAASEAQVGEAFALWGRLELRARDEAAAIAVLEKWIDVDTTLELQRRRVDLALAVGRFDLAVDDLLILADERRPRHGERLVEASQHACRAGTALEWFRSRGAVRWGEPWARSALELARNTADARLEGDALMALDADGEIWMDWLLARHRYEEVLEDAGDDGYRRGLALRGLGRHEEALKIWSEIDNEGVAGLRVASEVVDLLLELERFEDALVAAEKAAQNPSDLKATTWLRARALAALGRDAEAEDAIGRAWTGSSRDRRIARLRSESGADLERVRAALQSAVEKGNAAAQRDLARLEERNGGDPLPAWEGLLRLDPDDVDAWVGVARLDPERREEALRNALEADACDAEALLEASLELPPCEALVLLDRAWEARPNRGSVATAREGAKAACGGAL